MANLIDLEFDESIKMEVTESPNKNSTPHLEPVEQTKLKTPEDHVNPIRPTLEEPLPGDEDKKRIQILEDQVEALKGICGEVVGVNRLLNDKLAAKTLMKPRDITILELEHLKGVEGEGRLSFFLSQVENCSLDTEERKRIVTTRLDPRLAIYVQTVIDSKDNLSWSEFKHCLKEELTDQNKEHVFDEISSMRYNFHEDPTEFVTSVRCKFALLGGQKGNEVPNINRILKQKLISGLPRLNRDRLELFKDENIPMVKFLDKFGHERDKVLAQTEGNLRAIKEEGEGESSNAISRRLDGLEQKLRQVGNATTPRKYPVESKYCSYCRSTSHNLRDCRLNPPRGVCFDCRRPNCRRGLPTCTGKINNTR